MCSSNRLNFYISCLCYNSNDAQNCSYSNCYAPKTGLSDKAEYITLLLDTYISLFVLINTKNISPYNCYLLKIILCSKLEKMFSDFLNFYVCSL